MKYEKCIENQLLENTSFVLQISWIFIKSFVVVNYDLLSLSSKFHEDSCINVWARVVNVRIRDKTFVCAFTTRVHARILMKFET